MRLQSFQNTATATATATKKSQLLSIVGLQNQVGGVRPSQELCDFGAVNGTRPAVANVECGPVVK
jgi:hypothetical protein